MRKIAAIAQYTFIGNLRNRVFLVLVLFGLLLLGSSVLLGLLSQEQELRMLTDMGLAAIEVLALFMAVFLMVNLLLEEIESKTIYLILTRSIGRAEYLLGRFLGTLASVLSCVVLMTLAHVVLLWAKGWKFGVEGELYFLSVFMSFEKIFLISAIALFFSLFSSSAIASVVFTFFFWVLGHFAMELKFLASQIQGEWTKGLFKGLYYLIPHFQFLNARDLWVSVGDRLPSFVFQGTAYTVLYSAAAFALAMAALKKKEF